MSTVFTRNKKFDGFFKTRWAAEGERKVLEQLESPGALIEPFRFLRQLKELNVTAAGVSCVFDYGSPPYIPSDVVEHLLPAMERLARVFETPENERGSLSAGFGLRAPADGFVDASGARPPSPRTADSTKS